MPQQPAHTIRVGNLHVTIWRNVNDKGSWYTIDPARSYKKGDETWDESSSLNRDDALIMAELLRQGWAWVTRQEQAEYKASKVRQEAAADHE
jgi:hypothetical protein